MKEGAQHPQRTLSLEKGCSAPRWDAQHLRRMLNPESPRVLSTQAEWLISPSIMVLVPWWLSEWDRMLSHHMWYPCWEWDVVPAMGEGCRRAPPQRTPCQGLNIVTMILRSFQLNFQTHGCWMGPSQAHRSELKPALRRDPAPKVEQGFGVSTDESPLCAAGFRTGSFWDAPGIPLPRSPAEDAV